jgi:hypothetical protein
MLIVEMCPQCLFGMSSIAFLIYTVAALFIQGCGQRTIVNCCGAVAALVLSVALLVVARRRIENLEANPTTGMGVPALAMLLYMFALYMLVFAGVVPMVIKRFPLPLILNTVILIPISYLMLRHTRNMQEFWFALGSDLGSTGIQE